VILVTVVPTQQERCLGLSRSVITLQRERGTLAGILASETGTHLDALPERNTRTVLLALTDVTCG
jgi:hypothetical protein